MGSSEDQDQFRRVYLPYCIKAVDGRGHVVLNRHYKPLGVAKGTFVDYADYATPISGLTAAKAAKISFRGDSSVEAIYLYNDGCIPTASPDHWGAYQARLALLAKLKVG